MIIWHQSNSTQSKSALDGVSILCFHYTILVKKRSIQAVLPAAVCFTTIYSHTDALLGMPINDREKHCYILNRGQTVKHTSTTTVTFKLKLFVIRSFFLWLTIPAACFNFAACKAKFPRGFCSCPVEVGVYPDISECNIRCLNLTSSFYISKILRYWYR